MKPITRRAFGGEYSTVLIVRENPPMVIVETLFFPATEGAMTVHIDSRVINLKAAQDAAIAKHQGTVGNPN